MRQSDGTRAMSKLLHFPDPRRIMQEASEWLVTIEEGLSDEERRRLEEWLAADQRHSKALAQLAKVWGAFDALTELAEMFPLARYRARRTQPRLLKAAAAAATVAGVAALGWYLLAGPAKSGEGPAVAALTEQPGAVEAGADRLDPARRSYQTAIGEQLTARQPDGSVITLNTDTALEVDYAGAERLITITRGEASFNVAHDAARPFRVVAGSTVVQALGTVFNVQLEASDRVEVTVSEGRVRITAAERPSRSTLTPTRERPEVTRVEVPPVRRDIDMTVTAGELAVIGGPEEAVRRIDTLEIEAQLAWQQGMLIFRGSPLESVLADVSRYTTVRFTIADDSIRSTRVGGYFRAGDVDALLVALRESFGIEPRRAGDEIILTARR